MNRVAALLAPGDRRETMFASTGRVKSSCGLYGLDRSQIVTLPAEETADAARALAASIERLYGPDDIPAGVSRYVRVSAAPAPSALKTWDWASEAAAYR